MTTHYALILVDGFELNSVVSIFSAAGRASFVQIFFDMVPTKATNLDAKNVKKLYVVTSCRFT